MAKIVITIEDDPNREGYVKVTPNPSFDELTKRIVSGDAPSTADVVASTALLFLRNKGKSSLIKPIAPPLLRPNQSPPNVEKDTGLAPKQKVKQDDIGPEAINVVSEIGSI